MGHQYKVVALEEFFCPIPEFDFRPDSYTIDRYQTTPRGDLELLHKRVGDAEVILVTTFPLTAATLSADVTPKLQLIVVMSVGTDCIDLEACKARGIRVVNCPQVNKEAVCQHAIALYLASRRKLTYLQKVVVNDGWTQQGSLIKHLDDHEGRAPLSWQDEVAGIFGYGAIGQRIASVCETLGMKVLIADRAKPAQQATTIKPTSSASRTPFTEVLKQATVIFLCMPRTPDTINLITASEFSQMHPSAVLVNVSRGGIVDENALLEALRQGQIAGAATDVFTTEPAGRENSPLLEALAHPKDTENLPLIVSPHVAWYSNATSIGLQRMTKESVEAWHTNSIPEDRIVA